MWTLKNYLIVTGVGAFLAMAMPWLVIIGVIFGVVPGLILMIMPTAFLYGLGFALVRTLLATHLSGLPLNILSVLSTIALFWLLPQPGLMLGRMAYASTKMPDVKPAKLINLHGDILLERPFIGKCDSLCAALLRTPGVTSVRIISRRGTGVTYRLGKKGNGRREVTATGFGLVDNETYKAKDGLAPQVALEAEWNLLLAGGRSLLTMEDNPKPDFTITVEDGYVDMTEGKQSTRWKWSLRPEIPKRRSLTISDSTGTVLLRNSIVEVLVPAAPLHIGAEGGIENFRFQWVRQRLGDKGEHATVPVESLILKTTDVKRGVDFTAALASTREELVRALSDPSRPADDPAFALAAQWMESFRGTNAPLGPDDRALLAKVLEDSRVKSGSGLLYVARNVAGNSDDLRRSIMRRLISAPRPANVSYWFHGISNLPEGAFARQLPEEREILSSARLAIHARGLIARQADRGVAAVPDLLRLLNLLASYTPESTGFGDVTEATKAVRVAFRRIGAAAAPARPEIERLLQSTPEMQRRYLELDKERWDVLLVVLGRPANSLKKPRNLSGTDQSYQERIAQLAARPYDWSRDW